VVVVSPQEVKRLTDIVTGLINISEHGISGRTLIMERNGNQEKTLFSDSLFYFNAALHVNATLHVL